MMLFLLGFIVGVALVCGWALYMSPPEIIEDDEKDDPFRIW